MIQSDHFANELIGWYLRDHRDLPWRNTTNPYHIWVSEIILQQTRVNQGISYYHRFVSAFPDVNTLAEADESEVLKLWEGLGYYSRARNMHQTAKMIVRDYGGAFPNQPSDLMKLKGIGKYTANAIASIAFHQPVAVVDGNVKRVIARLEGITQPVDIKEVNFKIEMLVQSLLDEHRPGLFNQALMEFGALRCTPANPSCNTCIFSARCVAYNTNQVRNIPRKSPKPKQEKRFFNYLLVRQNVSPETRIAVRKRNRNDIWKNLYELPCIESKELLDIDRLKDESLVRLLNIQATSIRIAEYQVKHVLSHQIIYARLFTAEVGVSVEGIKESEFEWIPEKMVLRHPFPRLLTRLFQKTGFYP